MKPNRILIHGGCNDIYNKTSTPENIAKDLLEIAKTCRGYGVNDVFISSIICRRNKFLNEKFQHVNFLLKLIYEENGYLYTLKMEIIKVGDLWKNVSIFQNMKKVNYLGIIYIFKRFLHKLQTSFHIIFFRNCYTQI